MKWKIRFHAPRHKIDGAVLSATEVEMFRPNGSSFIAYMVLGKRDDNPEWCSVFFDDYWGHDTFFSDVKDAEKMIRRIKRSKHPHILRYTTMGQINDFTFSEEEG